MGSRLSAVRTAGDVKVLREFRAFLARGNALDLAIGVILGIAFGAVITSLVNDVLMPPIGLALGGTDFKDLFIVLKEGTAPGPYATLEAATAAGAVTWRYGTFLNAVVNFLIIAFVIFLLVRAVARMRAKDEAVRQATEKDCPRCLLKVPIKATRCGHCTSDLEPAATI